ncbi:hemolysin type calcium-binding protein, partial [Novosphingobium kunmingense]
MAQFWHNFAWWYSLPITITDTSGNDAISGTDGADHISGNSGDDEIAGLGGDDYLEGGNEIDTLYGGAGNDMLDPGRDQDTVYGGPDDDYYLIYGAEAAAQDTLIEAANEGFDWIRSSQDGYGLPFNFEGLFLHIDGGGGLAYDGSGNELDNVIVGQGLANHIFGLGGNDLLLGEGGNDWLDGGSGSDWLEGGLGSDWFVGSTGNDVMLGDGGSDTFDLRAVTFVAGQSVLIDGAGSTGDPASPDVDTLVLTGRATDWTFTTTFEDGVQPTRTVLTNNLTGTLLYTQHLEALSFTAPVNNLVNLYQGNLVLELIRLAGESYGALETLDHLAEPLASTGTFAAWAAAGVAAEATQLRHWHALSALELGIPAAYTHPQTGLQYSLTNGHYQAIYPSPVGIVDTSEANALVLIGVVNGVTTLALAFRGTDQFADFADYPDFTLDHYAKFKPLIDAIDAYVADPANGIQQVLVSGHSLGAGMVQEFMSDHAGSLYQAVTIGSPGSDNNDGIEDDPRIVNFAHTSDAVAMIAPALSQAAPILSAWLLLQGQVTLAAIIGKIQPKDRDGSDVYVNSDIATFPGITEHAWTNYLASVTTILERAVTGPFSLHPFAAALRAELVYSGDDVQIAIGQPGSSKITSWTGDNFVLGSSAADSIEWSGVTPLGEYRVIDAGLGSDELILPGLKASWGWDNLGGHYALSFLGLDVGELWNVEKLVFTFFSDEELQQAKTAFAAAEPAPVIPVVYLNGQAASVQQAVPGASVLNVDPDVDYVETGNSTLMVNGSADNDIIMLGGGNQTIDGGAGNDVVNAVNAASGGVFAVTGGGGDDLVIGSGGARMKAVFSGNAADYGADERGDGGIILTDLRPGSPDGEDTLLQVVTLRFADGDITAAQFLAERVPVLLQGTDDDDALIPARDGTVIAIGLAGDDSLEGGARADLLDGGTGADHLYGHAGDDMYLVNQLADTVFEGDGEGTDTVTASGNFYLYANIENLVQAAGA